MTRINKEATFSELPTPWPHNLLPGIRKAVAAATKKIVVLDDDPTGTQTVHGVSVLTDWSVDILSKALASDSKLFFILTNSRSLNAEEAETLNRDVARHLAEASSRTGTAFELISRSDSTLRGHYPGEIDWLVDELDLACDGVILAPFFPEGGRYTIKDVHYVAAGEWLVPAGDTEFAQDPTFGYQHSNLRDWVEEKTGSMIRREDVAAVSLDTLRTRGPEAVTDILLALHDRQPCVVNAADYRDLEVLVSALLKAQSMGKSFVFRTAASFVRVRGGITPRPLLSRSEMLETEKPQQAGLLLVGSYVDKTTRQLKAVMEAGLVHPIEVSVSALLDPETYEAEVGRSLKQVEQIIHSGETAAVFTSREVVRPEERAAFLRIGQTISQGLIDIVRGLGVQPAWLVAKGGITSSVIATQGLGVRQAQVMGQILPGVPVWKLGAESRFPGCPYVVFPGNVGGEDALVRLVEKLNL